MDVSDIGSSWHNFSNIVYSVSKEVLGTPNRKHQDWFDDQDADIQIRLHAKNQLFRSHLNEPNSVAKRDTYVKAKRDCQRDLQSMQNDPIIMIGLAKNLQRSKHMLRQITLRNSSSPSNAIYGRQSSTGSAPLKDAKGEPLITDKGKILERWKEHFDDVLNRPSTINQEAINRVPQIDVNQSMPVLPTLEEVNKAIASLSVDKAPDSDGIPPEEKRAHRGAKVYNC